jgi:GH25 family lysozyme M1 (1,4-beta-N-acetylmuramidase)
MTRTPTEAIAWGQAQVGKHGWDNLCLRFVRLAFGVDYVGNWPTSERDAGRAWDRAIHKHRTTDPKTIPRGVPVFWELNTEADHVALSLGDGWCLSNDFVVNGRIDRVRIADISARWGRLLGWTEDLVGNRVVPRSPSPEGMRVDGVDISHHQEGAIDYAAAKKAGVKWMYHKATEGATYTDPNYARRREQVKAAGIPFGAYHFARAGKGDAVAEARHFLSVAKPKPGDLRPALDLETTEGLSLSQIRAWASRFIGYVEDKTGVLPVVYTPFDLGEAAAEGCVIWRPRYNDRNEPPELAWDIWQFSNGVYGVPDSVAGFGHVDLNTMRDGLDLADLLIPKRRRRKRWAGPVTAVYYNIGDGPRAKKRRDLDRFAAKGAHLILLAECSDRVDTLKAWAEKNGWTYTDGDGSPGAAATPALIRNDLRTCVESITTTEATPSTVVGAPGAGPVKVKRKVVQRIRIRRRWKIGIPRRPLEVIWGHYLPSAAREGLANHDLRETLHRRHTRANLAAVSEGAQTLIVADFNCEWDAALMDPYRKAGFKQLPTGPTHGRQTIDYWLTTAKASRRPDRVRRGIARVFTVAGSSDHNAVVVETT